MYKLIFLLLINTLLFGTLQAQTSYLDPSFGNGGIVRDTSNDPFQTSCFDLLLLPDGRILSTVMHYKYDPSSVSFWLDLIRLNSDGTPDITFGNNGKIMIQPTITSLTFPPFNFNSWREDINTESLFDGKIMTSFSYKVGDTLSTAVSQWLPDGSPDLGFGDNGSVRIVDMDSTNYSPFYFARKKMSNGQFVLIYYNAQIGTNQDIGFRFFTPDGQALLPNNAIQWNHTPSYTEIPTNAWILPDNKILIGCRNVPANSSNMEEVILQRFTSNGIPDPDFGYLGIASPSTVLQYFGQTEMVLLADGRILVGQMNDAVNVLMARFLPNGALDTTFGDQGHIRHSNLFGGLNYWGFSISNASPSGSFYVAGHKFVQTNFEKYEAALFRVYPNGAIDSTFSSDTIVYLPKNVLGFESTSSRPIVGSDGRILISGAVNFSRFLFARFLPEPGAVPWYKDADADGFGDAQQVLYAANQPVNYTSITGDCADNNPSIYLGAPEICNGLDDNCDGKVDNLPVLAQCKSGIVVSLPQQGQISLSPEAIWQPPAASSCNANWTKFVLNPSNFNCSDIGAKSVMLTITDIWGTSSTCQTVIAVQDTLPPVLACKNNVELLLDANGNATVLPAQLLNGSFDNCGINSIVLSQSSFTNAHIGTNLVQVTALDGSGNTTTCATKVLVESPTGTDQIDLAQLKFSITPNPATDLASIHIPSQYQGKTLWIRVTDASGRLVYTQKAHHENRVDIHLKEWPSAQYFISISTGNNILETLNFHKL